MCVLRRCVGRFERVFYRDLEGRKLWLGIRGRTISCSFSLFRSRLIWVFLGLREFLPFAASTRPIVTLYFSAGLIFQTAISLIARRMLPDPDRRDASQQ